jgi:hypothetical protein
LRLGLVEPEFLVEIVEADRLKVVEAADRDPAPDRPFGQRMKADTALLEVGHSGEEMRQRSAKSVQLPDDQAIPGFDESQRLGQASTITAAPSDPILE